MDVQQLRYFLAVKKTENVSSAAQSLYVSRQAVSKAIQALETELGLSLVERGPKHLHLTLDGLEFAHQAERVVRLYDELVHNWKDRGSDNGMSRFNLGISTTLFFNQISGVLNFANIVDSAQKKGSLFVRQASSKDCYCLLLNNELDAAIILSMQREYPECEKLELRQYRMAVLVHKDNDLFERHRISISDLQEQKLIVFSDYEYSLLPLLRQCAEMGFDLRPSYLIDEISLANEMLSKNMGILIADVDKDRPLSPDCRMIPFRESSMTWSLQFVFRRNSPKRKQAMKYAEMLKGHFVNA